jgi:hypothetical protein
VFLKLDLMVLSKQSLLHADFLLGLLCKPKDGGDTFL